MTHLFKVPLDHADIFITELDLEALTIRYRVYDPAGKPQEPERSDKLLPRGEKMFFGLSRDLPLETLLRADLALNGENAVVLRSVSTKPELPQNS